MLDWMAWTWPTAGFFVFIFLAIATMGFLEWRHPGGAPRLGILGLNTTRGDRLFLSLLGSAYILLAWLGIVGTPIWGGLVIALLWGTVVFTKVYRSARERLGIRSPGWAAQGSSSMS